MFDGERAEAKDVDRHWVILDYCLSGVDGLEVRGSRRDHGRWQKGPRLTDSVSVMSGRKQWLGE